MFRKRLPIQRFAVITVLLLLLGTGYARTKSSAAGSSKQPAASKQVRHSSNKSKRSAKKAKKSSWRHRGQKAIDAERAREIQAALIHANYMQGQPSGVWDDRTRSAMVRFQKENGWQTKVVPDSRALIKLGLGPDRADLINPDEAMITLPGGGMASNTAGTQH